MWREAGKYFSTKLPPPRLAVQCLRRKNGGIAVELLNLNQQNNQSKQTCPSAPSSQVI